MLVAARGVCRYGRGSTESSDSTPFCMPPNLSVSHPSTRESEIQDGPPATFEARSSVGARYIQGPSSSYAPRRAKIRASQLGLS